MALFVEVNSFEKKCKVIVNLDQIVEIAPLVDGGCILFMSDSAGMNSRQGIRVDDNYSQFLQFAMQTVTAEDIQRRFPKVTVTADDSQDPTGEVPRGRGRPPKTQNTDIEIPKL
jgi:hypothetical protein